MQISTLYAHHEENSRKENYSTCNVVFLFDLLISGTWITKVESEDIRPILI